MEKPVNTESTSPPMRVRGSDRRDGSRVGPPPYYTREGKILQDRRSHFDRRGTWIRGFSLDTGNGSMTEN